MEVLRHFTQKSAAIWRVQTQRPLGADMQQASTDCPLAILSTVHDP